MRNLYHETRFESDLVQKTTRSPGHVHCLVRPNRTKRCGGGQIHVWYNLEYHPSGCLVDYFSLNILGVRFKTVDFASTSKIVRSCRHTSDIQPFFWLDGNGSMKHQSIPHHLTLGLRVTKSRIAGGGVATGGEVRDIAAVIYHHVCLSYTTK